MSPQTNTFGTDDLKRVVARDVAPAVDVDAEVVEQPVALRAEEAHREEHQLTLELEIGAVDLHEGRTAFDDDRLHLVGAQRAHVPA